MEIKPKPLTPEREAELLKRVSELEAWFVPRDIGAQRGEMMTLVYANKVDGRVTHGAFYCRRKG